MKLLATTLALAFAISGCGRAPEAPPERPVTHHLVGVDLSDRILQPDQIRRDTTFLFALVDAFISEGGNRDRLSIEVIPQSSSQLDLYRRADLQIDLGALTFADRRRGAGIRLAERAKDALADIYRRAEAEQRHSGADTWTWIQGLQLPATTTAGDSIRSSLLILHDGYLLAEANLNWLDGNPTFMSNEALQNARTQCSSGRSWDLSLATPRSDLGNLWAFSIVEVRPRLTTPCELRLLVETNANWASAMGVDNPQIFTSQGNFASLQDRAHRLIIQSHQPIRSS